LRAEVTSDRRAFERLIDELRLLDLGAAASSGDRARAAVALHHAYGAVESLLARVCRQFEGALPAGPDWHQALLESMALDIEGVRPAVLSAEALHALRRLLAFRHFFRHAYSTPLDGERLAILRDDAEAAAVRLHIDLGRFDAFLSELAQRTPSAN
jgi:hypothetical protein